MPKHSFEAAEKYILSREFFGMKLGLENIQAFLELIGSPQTKYKTIHIAGTNGKGSTASMLASVLRKEGYKTGLFTSPHLVSLRERVQVDGIIISKKSVSKFIDGNRKLLTKRKLSFFELITAMALDHFANSNIDIAVIETGLGGRLDATNVLRPILTVTTDISKDHMEILGSKITTIAREKAGIIKPGVDHLVGILEDNANDVIKKRCKKLKAKFHYINKNEIVFDCNHLRIQSKIENLKFKYIEPSLVGTHQLKNAALVVKACSILKENGIKLKKSSVKYGIENTNWRGRFQVVERKNKPIHIFDVSHNVKGVEAFVNSFKIKFPNRKAQILTGFVKRKEHQKMFDLLSEIACFYTLIPLSTKRTTDINELIKTINFKNIPYKKYAKLETGYKFVVNSTTNDDIIIIIGSHYLVGEFINKYNIK